MKKILVLTMMVMLVASMSVMASDVTVSGQVQYEWAQDFETLYDYNADAELVVTAVVDDYNTAVVDFDYTQNSPATTNMISLDKAYFTTAIGKYAGLEDMGVTITLIWGWQEWADPGYGMVTNYENERVWDAKAENWQVNIDVGIMDMVHIEAAMMPANDVGNEMMFGAYGGMDPVWVEVYYTQEGVKEIGSGILGIAANFGMDIMPGMYAFDVGLNFGYNLNSDTNSIAGMGWELGVGVANTIMEMVYLNLGFAGNDDSIFLLFWVELGADYQGIAGADLGVGMIMDDAYAPEMMDEIDFSVWVAVGAATFRVGYCMTNEDNGLNPVYEGYNAPGDADHDPTVAAGVVYFSGTVDF